MQIDYQQDLIYRNSMSLSCLVDKVIILDDESEIVPVMTQVVNENKGFLILSGGSNVILPKRLTKTVIFPKFYGIHVLRQTEQHVEIEVMAGQAWHQLVLTCTQQGWYGLENLALIAGLVGAAPVQNIGAYGVQIADCLTHVRAYHIASGQWHVLDNKACQFGYRDSLFKREPNTWLIARVGLRLHKDMSFVQMGYGDVKKIAEQQAQHRIKNHATNQNNNDNHNQSIQTNPMPLDVMNAVIRIRQSKLPDPKFLPNCGSFFQNPIITQADYEILLAEHPNMPCYSVADNTVTNNQSNQPQVKIPAAWLIEQAGFKGKGIYPILTHDKQALVLTNHCKFNEAPATQADVAATKQLIINTVKKKYDIDLCPEPVWITDF